jgi:hypothetical protein
MRLDVERELFLLSRLTPRIESDITTWSVRQHIDELEKSKAIEPDLAGTLREFVTLANTILHGITVPDKDARSAATVGSLLVAKLRHKRLVATLEHDFDGHLLWHAHRHEARSENQYYFWSAVAASLPEFGYDFDVYQEASQRYLQKLQVNHPDNAGNFHILSLDEFIAVLEFRERELQRIIKLWSGSGWEDRLAIEWQWPTEWGHIGWTGPILRERVHLWGAQEELMLTRAALDSYRPRLRSQKHTHYGIP